MQRTYILTTGLMLSLTLILPAGCQNTQARRWEPAPSASQTLKETVPQGPSAVDSAIELSKRCAQLTEDIAALKQEKQSLAMEKQRLESRLAILEPELAQAKKELDQANDLLIEMRLELNNWKTSVIGFREEMRRADAAQLKALLKIYELLGGQTPAEPAQEPNRPSDTANESVIRIQSNPSNSDKTNA